MNIDLLPPQIKSVFVVSNSTMVSRTTKGGRRRKFSISGVMTGVNQWISYAVPLTGKSIQKFSSLQRKIQRRLY